MLSVTQKVDGAEDKTTSVTVTLEAAEFTAAVVSTDAGAGTAVIGGTGQPGADVTVTGPAGARTVGVGQNGEWRIEVDGLVAGDNAITVEHKIGDDVRTEDLVVTLLPSPVVDPVIAGGVGIGAMAALGALVLRRRTVRQ